MIRGFRQIVSLTAVSRIFGFVRDMCYAYFIGADRLFDAWAIAFRIPNLSRRLFGEGAASASFIPVYSEALAIDREQAARLANTVVTAIFVLLAAIILVGEAGIWLYYVFAENGDTRLILSLTGVMLPEMLFMCLVAILAGILNVHRHFAAPAAAPIVMNIFIIVAVVVAGKFMNISAEAQLFWVAAAVLSSGVAQLLMQWGPLRRSGIHIRPMWEVQSEAFRKILILMGPMILGLTATQINTLADDMIAWWFSGSEDKGQFFEFFGRQIQYPMWRGSVSFLYYAQRLYQLPLGIFGISLATAIFPVMSAAAAKKDFGELCKTVSRSLQATLFVALPATAGLILVARPFIAAFFQHGEFTADDTAMVVTTLAFYSLGLCGYFAQQLLGRAFYSLLDSKTPMRTALMSVAANVVLNLTLIWFMGQAGLACATAICSYLQVFMLIAVLRRRLGAGILDGVGKTALKTTVATVLMAAVGAGILMLCSSLPLGGRFDALRLVLTVPPAAAAYWLTATWLDMETLSMVTGIGRKRAGQPPVNEDS